MSISMIILTEKGDIMALEETVLDGENMTNFLKANWDMSKPVQTQMNYEAA